MDLGFRMHAERTPNPNSVKWVLSQDLASGRAAHFDAPVPPQVSPLAARLFAVPGVAGVFMTGNQVTVTKREDPEWTDLAQGVVDAIKAFSAAGEEALGPDFEEATAGSDDPIVSRILEILDRDIRPAVEMDGGDIVFVGYEEGQLQVSLVGACAGCPSSTVTLRMGIEARLKEEIPELREVISV